MTDIKVLSVLFIRDNERNFWIARCLEHDVTARGGTIPAVKRAFEKALEGQLRANEHFGNDPWDIPAAPAHVFEAWNSATGIDPDPIRLPEFLREKGSIPRGVTTITPLARMYEPSPPGSATPGTVAALKRPRRRS